MRALVRTTEVGVLVSTRLFRKHWHRFPRLCCKVTPRGKRELDVSRVAALFVETLAALSVPIRLYGPLKRLLL